MQVRNAKMSKNMMLDCKTDYENFSAQCPFCQKWNIYNRASDLQSFDAISGRGVVCFHCQQDFWINCDSCSLDFKKLILNSWSLVPEKKYMYIVINLCMAYELFFSTYIHNILVVKSVNEQREKIMNDDEFEMIEECNRLSKMLYNKIKTLTYGTLMSVFIKLVLDQNNPSILEIFQAEKYIKNIKPASLERLEEEIKKSHIQKKLKGYLLALVCMQRLETSISYLRNKVVHKYAYRPRLMEVERELKIAELFIFGIKRNINFS